jgi:hypothetical protein
MRAEGDRRRSEGWAVEEIPRNCAFFFCDRHNARVCVSIECYEPGAGRFATMFDPVMKARAKVRQLPA